MLTKRTHPHVLTHGGRGGKVKQMLSLGMDGKSLGDKQVKEGSWGCRELRP